MFIALCLNLNAQQEFNLQRQIDELKTKGGE